MSSGATKFAPILCNIPAMERLAKLKTNHETQKEPPPCGGSAGPEQQWLLLSMLLEKLRRRHAIARITWGKKECRRVGKGDSLNHLFARP